MNPRNRFNNFVRGGVLDLSSGNNLFEERENYIQNKDIPNLCQYLKEHPEIDTLSLRGCELNINNATKLADNNTIKELIIGGNEIGTPGWKILAQMKKLERIRIQGSNLSDNDILKFIDAFSESANVEKISAIDFSINAIGDEGAIALAQFCSKLFVLSLLNLKGNYIGEDGGRALAERAKTNSYLKIIINPQHGSLLENASVLTAKQWMVLNDPVDTKDLMSQANKERRVGLHNEVPSLKDIALFKVANDKELAQKANNVLPTELKDELKQKKR